MPYFRFNRMLWFTTLTLFVVGCQGEPKHPAVQSQALVSSNPSALPKQKKVRPTPLLVANPSKQEQAQQAHQRYLARRKQQWLQQRTQQTLFRQQLQLRKQRMQQRFAQWNRIDR